MGELMIMAWVRGVMRRSTWERSIWKARVSAGTTTRRPPLDSVKGRYSGKNGATAMISESSSASSALMTAISPGAAPQVRNRFPGFSSMPNRRFRLAAMASRAASKPQAMEYPWTRMESVSLRISWMD